MKNSHFELRLTQRVVTLPQTTGDVELNSLNPEIYIDGEYLDEPHAVSVNAVLQSFANRGQRGWNGDWHYVFTCGCGDATCAYIDEGIGRVWTEEAVDWVFRRPQANRLGNDVLGFKRWCETAQWHHYRFDRHQATQELIRFLDEVWMVLNTSELEILGRQSVLIWFHDDPRFHLRGRSAGDDWSEHDKKVDRPLRKS